MAWFVDQDQHQHAARAAFQNWTTEDADGLREPTDEKGHLDLVIRLAGRGPLVIENKDEQLRTTSS